MDGFVKYKSSRSHARLEGIIKLMYGSRGKRTGYLIPALKVCGGGEGSEIHVGDSGEWPLSIPAIGEAPLVGNAIGGGA